MAASARQQQFYLQVATINIFAMKRRAGACAGLNRKRSAHRSRVLLLCMSVVTSITQNPTAHRIITLLATALQSSTLIPAPVRT